jgi:hypothetical protein
MLSEDINVGHRRTRVFFGHRRGKIVENDADKHYIRMIRSYKPYGRVKITDFFSNKTPDELMREICDCIVDFGGIIV